MSKALKSMNGKVLSPPKKLNDEKVVANANPRYQFKVKILSAQTIKILFEILHYYVRTVCVIRITPTGIYICENGDESRVILNISINASNLAHYICRQKRTFHMGLEELYTTLKRSIKKTDILEMYIENSNPNQFVFLIQPNGSRCQKSKVSTNIVDVNREMSYNIPSGYNSTINITSVELQKMCRGMEKLNENTVINVPRPRCLEMVCVSNGPTGRSSIYELEDDEFTEEELNGHMPYKGTLKTLDLTKLMKLVGLCKNVQIETDPEKPIKFTLPLGDIGMSQIFFRSNEQLEEMANETDSENESEDFSDAESDVESDE